MLLGKLAMQNKLYSISQTPPIGKQLTDVSCTCHPIRPTEIHLDLEFPAANIGSHALLGEYTTTKGLTDANGGSERRSPAVT